MKKTRLEIPLVRSEIFEGTTNLLESDSKGFEKMAEELRPSELLSTITEKSLPLHRPKSSDSLQAGSLAQPSRPASLSSTKRPTLQTPRPNSPSLIDALLEFHRSRHKSQPAANLERAKSSLSSPDRIEVNSNFYRPRGARTILRPKS